MSKRLDSKRLQHLVHAATYLISRLHAVALADFLTHENSQDIALRRFMVMDEAAHVSTAVWQQYPQID